MEQLEGLPAVIYTGPWLARELGIFKNICDDLKIDKLKILLHLEDYKPGALISIDGQKGDYTVTPVENPEGVECDGAIFGKVEDIVSSVESVNILLTALVLIIKRKIRIKGLWKLLKFAKLMLRCI
ncbi:MAG: hypothetical protein ACFFCS_28770 [Candidatus Hodarchaeota archaeon]